MQDKHSIGEEPCAGNLASTVLQQRVGQRCPTRLRLKALIIKGILAKPIFEKLETNLDFARELTAKDIKAIEA
jgi:hypothetical protein